MADTDVIAKCQNELLQSLMSELKKELADKRRSAQAMWVSQTTCVTLELFYYPG